MVKPFANSTPTPKSKLTVEPYLAKPALAPGDRWEAPWELSSASLGLFNLQERTGRHSASVKEGAGSPRVWPKFQMG